MTFVRVGQFKALAAKVEELRTIYEAEAIPAIRAAPGNISALLLQQHQARDAFMAITLWETAADAERYERSGQAAAMVDKIRFAFAEPLSLATYDAFGIPG
ncbi:antibiotic biosynthesis monooxygenase [Mesorhizobium sp. CA14]|nr:antibiotic biosynthesis monooxygenase [Mesorhizobium sp. CA14]